MNDAGATFLYLVTYDIADDLRRVRVAERLADLGGQRVQRSVFWIRLDGAALAQFRQSMIEVIDDAADSLHWYRTCGNCPGIVANTRAAMLPPLSPEGAGWIV